MKRALVPHAVLLFLCLCLGAVSAAAQDKPAAMKMSAVPQSAEWKQLLALVGSWEGTMEESGQKVPAAADVRLTGDSSAIMHVLGKDSPYEMVTMIHPDGKRLLATHYCAAHNQPRMALVPSAKPNQVTFTFVDGTNIGPGEAHMQGVVFTFIDADHREEAWTSSGSDKPAIFTFARKEK